MASNKAEFISMSLTQEELDRITPSDFEALEIVGCCGSMDVVHRGWDSCPAEFKLCLSGRSIILQLPFK